MSAAPRVTVILAEDHQIVRWGLRTLLESVKDFSLLGEADDGRQAVELAKRLRPDVVVMDIAMPGLNGLEATRQILASLPGTRILILSAHADDAYVQGSMDAGAAGYLVKQASVQSLIDAVRRISRGEKFLCPQVSHRYRRQTESTPDRRGRARVKRPELSPRESEVLQLVAEGKANKQVAAALGISIKTVEKHRSSLMAKLDIHDTAGLTRHAISAGIIENSVQVTIL